MQAQFASNGRFMAYVSDESGSLEVYVQSFPASEKKWRISNSGGTQPRWRSDGKELFYISADTKLMVVGVNASSGELCPFGKPV